MNKCFFKRGLVALGFVFCGAFLPVWASEMTNCEYTGKMAAVIMDGRQFGIAMSKLLEINEGKMEKEMVFQAYDVPLYQSEEFQKRAIRDFSDRWEVACHKALRSNKGKTK